MPAMSHGHGHMPHASSHGGGEDEKLGGFRLELVIAVLLGLAAIVGALAAYAGHVSEGHSIKHFNHAVQTTNDANLFYTQGNQKLIQDQAIFLEYIKAASTNQLDFAVYVQKTLMSDDLKKAVKWWETGNNTKKYSSPFVDQDPVYVIPDYAKAAQLDTQTKARFAEGKKDEDTSNRYTLIEVLIASALFLYGIASVTRRHSIKLGFLAMGVVLFSLSVAQFVNVRYL
jgi:hypothetical protein